MRAAHLLLEGPDGGGKTTLAQALCAVGYAYRHEGPPPPTMPALQHYAGILARLDEPTLLDRFHLGERVYGPIVRGRSGLTPLSLRLLRRVLNGLGVRIVLCLPSYGTTRANWQRRRECGGEFLRDDVTFTASYQAIAALARDVHDVFDYEAVPWPIPEHIIDQLTAFRPICRPGVIGSPTASLLFLTDHTQEPFELPFITERGAGGFFNRCLERAGFEEHEIAFTTAYRPAGGRTDLVRRIRPGQRVIALGEMARRALDAAGVTDWATLPHPHDWIRFHPRESERFVRFLTDLRRDTCRAAS
jgi:hypothetical protein